MMAERMGKSEMEDPNWYWSKADKDIKLISETR